MPKVVSPSRGRPAAAVPAAAAALRLCRWVYEREQQSLLLPTAGGSLGFSSAPPRWPVLASACAGYSVDEPQGESTRSRTWPGAWLIFRRTQESSLWEASAAPHRRRPRAMAVQHVPGSNPRALHDGLCGRLADGHTCPKPPEVPAAARAQRRCRASGLPLGRPGRTPPRGCARRRRPGKHRRGRWKPLWGRAGTSPRAPRAVPTTSWLAKPVIIPPGPVRGGPQGRYDSYLVDSASSYMLVSKIKPCMSKYKQLYRETANGSLNQLSFI
jgi:hypothetical protein